MKAVIQYCLASLMVAGASDFVSATEISLPVRTVERPYVQLSDLVDLSAIAMDVSPESLLYLRKTPILPLHSDRATTYRPDDIRDAVTRRIPGMIDHLHVLPQKAMTFVLNESPQDDLRRCLVLTKPIDAGEPIRQNVVAESTACDATISREILSLRDGAVITESSLPTGAKLPISTTSLLPIHVRGDALTLISKIGPVTVSRPVEVLRSTSANGTMLVRTSNDKVLNAVLEPSASSISKDGKP